MSRTMIEKLGFQDPDKGVPDHDLACQYLTQSKVQQKLRTLISPAKKNISRWLFRSASDWKRTLMGTPLLDEWEKLDTPVKCKRLSSSYEACLVQKERPISKGEKQYKTTIGFIDVWMTFEHNQTWQTKLDNGDLFTFKSSSRHRVILEVKTVINVGEILRQLKLYTEYVKGVRLILVSTVPLTTLEHQALKDEGIQVVVLGESFERWKTSRMSEASAGVWEV